MRAMRVLLVLALLCSTAAADRRDDVAKLRGELIAAINKRDVQAVKTRLVLPLRVTSMVFVAPACAKFAGKVSVTEADLPAFVGCLADHGVTDLHGPDDLWINAVYGPGFPLIVVDAPVRAMFGSGGKTEMFVIEPIAFASHVKNFTREIVPAAALKKDVDDAQEPIVAIALVCVDGAGKVKVMAQVADTEFQPYARLVEKVVGKWSIKPFRMGGKGITGCARFAVGYPANLIKIPLATPRPAAALPEPGAADDADGLPPTAGPQNVPPTLLEASRISGEKVIVPDDMVKVKITESKRENVIGSFKLCIDTSGAITAITQLKSTGFPDYDAKIIRTMNTWKYRPYKVNGAAVPVCTAVTFIYSQK